MKRYTIMSFITNDPNVYQQQTSPYLSKKKKTFNSSSFLLLSLLLSIVTSSAYLFFLTTMTVIGANITTNTAMTIIAINQPGIEYGHESLTKSEEHVSEPAERKQTESPSHQLHSSTLPTDRSKDDSKGNENQWKK
jgi:hypothetical protein